jgi:hypothetical protein
VSFVALIATIGMKLDSVIRSVKEKGGEIEITLTG